MCIDRANWLHEITEEYRVGMENVEQKHSPASVRWCHGGIDPSIRRICKHFVSDKCDACCYRGCSPRPGAPRCRRFPGCAELGPKKQETRNKKHLGKTKHCLLPTEATQTQHLHRNHGLPTTAAAAVVDDRFRAQKPVQLYLACLNESRTHTTQTPT